MKRNKVYMLTLLSGVAMVTSVIISCVKQAGAEANPQPTASTCQQSCDSAVLGIYSGTYQSQLGSGTFVQYFKPYNFTDGSETLTGSITAAGSYWYCCATDSVKIRSLNSINSCYYSFDGKFSANRDTIRGTWANVTTPPEAGTFVLIKRH